MKTYFRALISATSYEEAQQVLNLLVNARLIAGGLITKGDSIHWWDGNIDKEEYYNISACTIAKHKDKIIQEVEKIHSDETPIIMFFKIDDANDKFLAWIDENTIT